MAFLGRKEGSDKASPPNAACLLPSMAVLFCCTVDAEKIVTYTPKLVGEFIFRNITSIFCWSVPDPNSCLKYVIFNVLSLAQQNYTLGSRGNYHEYANDYIS